VAGNGWNYEGNFGGFPGTAIAPHYFNTAALRQPGKLFTLAGVDYQIVAHFPDPQSALIIYQ
jgi:hypothetical protein